MLQDLIFFNWPFGSLFSSTSKYMTRTWLCMGSTAGMVTESSYRRWESTRCSMSGISRNECRGQIEKLTN